MKNHISSSFILRGANFNPQSSMPDFENEKSEAKKVLDKCRARSQQDPTYDPTNDPQAVQALETINPELGRYREGILRLESILQSATEGKDAVEGLEDEIMKVDIREILSSMTPRSDWFKAGMPTEDMDVSEARREELDEALRRDFPNSGL